MPVGTNGNDTLTLDNNGGAHGRGGDDTLILTKNGAYRTNQIHAYGGDGNDTFLLDVAVPDNHHVAVQGHHAFLSHGNDTVVFQISSTEHGRITGRIDDFDPSQDSLYLERDGGPRVRIDLTNPPAGVHLVDVKGQIALLIDGKALYVIEGARMATSFDPIDTSSHSGEEGHFPSTTTWPSSFQDVTYRPTHNFLHPSLTAGLPRVNAVEVTVPEHTHEDGMDMDHHIPVQTTHGTDGAEWIRANHNGQSDILYGMGGDDAIEGGKSHDTIYGATGTTPSRAAPTWTRSGAGPATTPSGAARKTTRSTAAMATTASWAAQAVIASKGAAAATG